MIHLKMDKKSRAKAIRYCIENDEEYGFLVLEKDKYKAINRPLNKDEWDKYCRINDRIEEKLQNALWFI